MNNTEVVVHGSIRSIWVPAQCGLPHGSVLGPILYTIYTSGVAQLSKAHAVLGQLYADDVQAYTHCLPSNAISAVRVMSGTMDALEAWMSSNRLRLNPSKTKFIRLLNLTLLLLRLNSLIIPFQPRFVTSASSWTKSSLLLHIFIVLLGTAITSFVLLLARL